MGDDFQLAESLKPLTQAWLRKIQVALDYRTDWDDTAEQCMAFFSGAVDYFWGENYQKKFVRGKLAPKFKLCLAKAFELVAIFSPSLFYRNPVRAVRPRARPDWPPEAAMIASGIDPQWAQQVFQAAQQAQAQIQQMQQMEMQRQQQVGMQAQAAGMPAPPPQPFQPPPQLQQPMMLAQQIQQRVQQTQQAEGLAANRLEYTAQVLESYLSYTPVEQPNGGLEQATIDCVTEALIKGRGVLFTRPYTHPGSGKVLTGSFWESASDIVTDPDGQTLMQGDTKWMALRHVNPTWEVERRFNLPKDSLKNKGNLESAQAVTNLRAARHPNIEKANGHTFDLIVWWEIWSVAGPGGRLQDTQNEMSLAIDDVVGDYAYIAVAEGVEYPLNASKEFVESEQTFDEDIKKAFDWPLPFYADNRWPCQFLEFYREPGNPYPVAPLKPGLGELTFLNILISSMCNICWNNSRQVWAVLESARDYVDNAMKGAAEHVVIPLKDIHARIDQVIQKFDMGELPNDLWKIAEAILDEFNKRVGLNELLYGLNAEGVSRSAADAQIKRENTSVRPDYMAKQVDSFMREVARSERLTAYFAGVSGKDVSSLLGPIGSAIWDQFVTQGDPETVLFEMDVTIEAGSARKPNKDRDMANVQQLAPALMPIFAKVMESGQVQPFNAFLDKIGHAMDEDVTRLHIQPPPGPPQKGPNPVMVQLEQAKLSAEAQRSQVDAQTAQVRMQSAQLDHQVQMAQAGQGLRHEQEEHEQNQQILKAKERMHRLRGDAVHS
jgi:hypothetical protein